MSVLLEMKKLLYTVSFLGLTATTQIGGVVYILSHWLAKKHSARSSRPLRTYLALYFSALYLISTYLVVPPLAAFFGRVPVAHSSQIAPHTHLTVLLNPNYVGPGLNE